MKKSRYENCTTIDREWEIVWHGEVYTNDELETPKKSNCKKWMMALGIPIFRRKKIESEKVFPLFFPICDYARSWSYS